MLRYRYQCCKEDLFFSDLCHNPDEKLGYFLRLNYSCLLNKQKTSLVHNFCFESILFITKDIKDNCGKIGVEWRLMSGEWNSFNRQNWRWFTWDVDLTADEPTECAVFHIAVRHALKIADPCQPRAGQGSPKCFGLQKEPFYPSAIEKKTSLTTNSKVNGDVGTHQYVQVNQVKILTCWSDNLCNSS